MVVGVGHTSAAGEGASVLGRFRERLLSSIARRVTDHLRPEIEGLVRARVAAGLEELGVGSLDKPWKKNIYIPDARLHQAPEEAPFMEYSTCSAADFFHPRYAEISGRLRIPLVYHRKYWEWVFIFKTAADSGVGRARKRALGFGVGTEPLPAALAGLGAEVVATDAPAEIGVGHGWSAGDEFAAGREALAWDGLITREEFEQRVSFRTCDMNDLSGDHLGGFDFCWSSCCLEHLGSIDHGLTFIVASVEKTLRPGGIACHTTELNLSSNDETIESGPTVLFRKRDLEGVIDVLRERGHTVHDLIVAPDGHHLDAYVDTPPYAAPPHLKLDIAGFTSTSAALVIERGP